VDESVKSDVVVVAYRSGDHLRGCVEPLCRENDIRVVVVDNACPEDSTATVADLPLEIVHMGRNAGFAAGCNAGAARGSGEAILFLNPDARISPSDVRLLASRLASHPARGAIAPRVINSTGELDLTMRREPSLGSALGEALFLHHVFRRSDWPTEFVRTGYDEPREADWVQGAAVMVRRDVFEQIGGFDERFFLYSEDADLGTRMRAAGYALRYEPEATAHHVGAASGKRDWPPLNIAARITYVRLHSRGPRYIAFRIAFVLNELLRLPLAARRSREDLQGRLRGLRVALGAERSPAHELVSPPARAARTNWTSPAPASTVRAREDGPLDR
jgi:N-acetylglucosaminyl-diphospho-decaprenol L-rhamnosyltransferase